MKRPKLHLRRRPKRRPKASVLALALLPALPPLLGAAEPLEAQGSDLALRTAALAAPATADPDFLFRAPRVSFTVRTGLFQYRADGGPGSFYDLTTTQFTAERSDFRSLDLGVEMGVAMTDRVDLVLAFDGGRVSLDHEDREFEELDGTPIFQSTELRLGPTAQLGLKGYLLPRGEQLSSLAWVPSTVAPFVGGGFGRLWYDVRQWGDFTFSTPEGDFIQNDDITAQGAAWVTWASGGADVALRRNLALTLEARYQWADDTLSGGFRLNDPTLDLSGLRLTAGFSVRY